MPGSTRVRIKALAALALLLTSSLAQAFWDPPFITPASPTPTDQIAVNVYMGDCDAIFAVPGYPQISQIGDAIRVVVFGQHWDPGELCDFTRGTGTYNVGRFAPGDYTITFDLDYVDFFSQKQVEALGVVPFSVTAATAQAPTSVPVLGDGPATLLALCISIVALLRMLGLRAS